MKRWVLFLLSCAIIGCAGLDEALHDRVGWELGGHPVTMTFGCDRPLQHLDESQPAGEELSIAVEAEPDPDVVQVGEMTGSWVAWVQGRSEIPILLTGPMPNAVLSRDVSEALSRHGFAVESTATTAGLRLHVGITEFATEFLPRQWYELAVSLRGRIAFRAELRRGVDLLWDGTFEAGDEVRYAYELASYRARVLSEAYCRCLEQFDQALDDPAFEEAARGPR